MSNCDSNVLCYFIFINKDFGFSGSVSCISMGWDGLSLLLGTGKDYVRTVPS